MPRTGPGADGANGAGTGTFGQNRRVSAEAGVSGTGVSAREAEVLAGRGERGELVDEYQLGQVGDGWGEQLVSLVDFPYGKYGIVTGK